MKFLLCFFAIVQLFTHKESSFMKSLYKACADFAYSKSERRFLSPKRIVVPSPPSIILSQGSVLQKQQIQSYKKEKKRAKPQFLISKAASHDFSWH